MAFSTAVTACEKGSQWLAALELLELMERRGPGERAIQRDPKVREELREKAQPNLRKELQPLYQCASVRTGMARLLFPDPLFYTATFWCTSVSEKSKYMNSRKTSSKPVG